MDTINTERNVRIFKEVLNGQTYAAMARAHQLSLSRPPQIVKRIVRDLLNKSKVKGIPHPFTFEKYPHAYAPFSDQEDRLYSHLLQPKDLHAEKDFLLWLLNQKQLGS